MKTPETKPAPASERPESVGLPAGALKIDKAIDLELFEKIYMREDIEDMEQSYWSKWVVLID